MLFSPIAFKYFFINCILLGDPGKSRFRFMFDLDLHEFLHLTTMWDVEIVHCQM